MANVSVLKQPFKIFLLKALGLLKENTHTQYIFSNLIAVKHHHFCHKTCLSLSNFMSIL